MSSATSSWLDYLWWWYHPVRVPARAFLVVWKPLPKGVFLKGGVMNLPVGEKTVAHLTVLDAKGNVLDTLPPPVPVWSSSDATVASVTAAADGMSASIKGLKLGSVTITAVVTTNADGSPKVSAKGSVTTITGEPASASMSFDTPTDDSEPEPTPTPTPQKPA